MKIFLAKTDDWTEVYIDGKSVYGNHRVSESEILSLAGIEWESKWYEEEDMEAMQWSFPKELKDLPEPKGR